MIEFSARHATTAALAALLLIFSTAAHAQTTTPVPEVPTQRAGSAPTGTTGTSQGGTTGVQGTDGSPMTLKSGIEAPSAPPLQEGPKAVDALIRTNDQIIPARPETMKARELKCLCTDRITNETKCEISCCLEQDHSACTDP